MYSQIVSEAYPKIRPPAGPDVEVLCVCLAPASMAVIHSCPAHSRDHIRPLVAEMGETDLKPKPSSIKARQFILAIFPTKVAESMSSGQEMVGKIYCSK